MSGPLRITDENGKDHTTFFGLRMVMHSARSDLSFRIKFGGGLTKYTITHLRETMNKHLPVTEGPPCFTGKTAKKLLVEVLRVCAAIGMEHSSTVPEGYDQDDKGGIEICSTPMEA